MKLGEAIEILYEHSVLKRKQFDEDLTEAEKLGIEALKAYKQARQERQLSPKELLPGETKT